MVVLKELILTVSTLEGCGGLERTHFKQLILWESVVVLKELIFTVSTVGGCDSLEVTDLFRSFYFRLEWWFCKI